MQQNKIKRNEGNEEKEERKERTAHRSGIYPAQAFCLCLSPVAVPVPVPILSLQSNQGCANKSRIRRVGPTHKSTCQK